MSIARSTANSSPNTPDDDGFGLVDALIALGLLVMVVSTTYLAMYDVVTQAGVARQRVAATELAEQWLETIANDPLTTLQAYIGHNVLLTPTPVTIVGTQFAASAHLEWSGTGSAPSLCLSGNPPQVITATVTVNWNVNVTLAETTVINPPYGTAVPTDGWVSVRVIGATGSDPPADVSSVVVAIDGTDYTPDQYGCVYQQEPAGTYTVAVSSAPGGPLFISSQENQAPSTAVTVVAGLTAFASFHYDQASTLTFSASAPATAATGMPISVGNPELTPLPWFVAVPAGATSTSATLFPYLSGYDVWFGDCTAEQPATPVNVGAPVAGSSNAVITGLAELSLEVEAAEGAAGTVLCRSPLSPLSPR